MKKVRFAIRATASTGSAPPPQGLMAFYWFIANELDRESLEDLAQRATG